MKHIFLLLIFIFAVTAFTGCESKQVDYNNPDVDLFVSELKSGTYQTKGPSGFVEVPHFVKSDIPQLMKYVNDMRAISDFPLPPNSSYTHAGKFRLGECMMWIIESIREGGNASFACQLVRQKSQHGQSLLLSDKEVRSVASLYCGWWGNVLSREKTKSPINPYFNNPLVNTEYTWN